MKRVIIVLLIMLAVITPHILVSQTTDTHMVKGNPVTGSYSEPLAEIDNTMVQFMKFHQIPAATVAIMKDGQILLRHGYGYSDHNQLVPTNPDILMRIASVPNHLQPQQSET